MKSYIYNSKSFNNSTKYLCCQTDTQFLFVNDSMFHSKKKLNSFVGWFVQSLIILDRYSVSTFHFVDFRSICNFIWFEFRFCRIPLLIQYNTLFTFFSLAISFFFVVVMHRSLDITPLYTYRSFMADIQIESTRCTMCVCV